MAQNFKRLIGITLAFIIGVLGQVHQVEGTSESIPVLLWSPEKRMSELETNDASSVGSDQFHKSYLTPLMHDASMAGVVFLQDKLHTDDFTQFADVYSLDSEGGVFANIKALMEENFSLEVPQVSQPLDSLEKLQDDFQGKTHTVSSLEDLEALKVTPGTSFLLMVRLPATQGSSDRESALQKNDELIGAVCRHLQKRSIKYVAAFTGEATGQSMTSEGEAHSSRHLLATVAKHDGFLVNVSSTSGGSNSFMFMKDIYICVKNKDKPDCVANFTLVPTNGTASGSVVANKTATIDLFFNDTKFGADDYSIRIKTEAILQGDRWVINKTSLYVIPSESKMNNSHIDNGTLSPGEMDFVVPILYSFHCTEMKMFLSTVDHPGFKGTYVTFNGYQFQPFKVQNDQFFNSVDCVGFFTTAIWMGLFPVAILLVILLYGTLMLLDLSIMDRYDDPKGKTITVHTATAEQ